MSIKIEMISYELTNKSKYRSNMDNLGVFKKVKNTCT